MLITVDFGSQELKYAKKRFCAPGFFTKVTIKLFFGRLSVINIVNKALNKQLRVSIAWNSDFGNIVFQVMRLTKGNEFSLISHYLSIIIFDI